MGDVVVTNRRVFLVVEKSYVLTMIRSRGQVTKLKECESRKLKNCKLKKPKFMVLSVNI